MKSAKLDRVIEREAEIGTHKIGAALTAGEAVALLQKATKVFAVVAIAPGDGQFFEVARDEAIERLKKLPPDRRVMCDLESDGWCWIGTTVN